MNYAYILVFQHLDHLDHRVLQVSQVTQVSLDLRVHVEDQVILDLKVSKANLDVPEELDSLDNLDHKDNKASPEVLEILEEAVGNGICFCEDEFSLATFDYEMLAILTYI